MRKRALTAEAVKRIKATPRGQVDHFDGSHPGLALRVSYGGRKTFVFIYRVPKGCPDAGRQRRMSLGKHPAITLEEARARWREEHAKVEAHRDPVAEQRLALAAPAVEPNTVARIVDQFDHRHVRKLAPRTAVEYRRQMRGLKEAWGDKLITDVSRHDVLEHLDALIDAGRPVEARNTYALIRKMFNWAVGRGIVTVSPVAGVEPPASAVSRDRVLEPAELAAVWRASESLGWPFGPMIKLLIATGVRRSEAATMRWRDVDPEARTWTIPRQFTKTDRAHVVPLSDLAMEVLAAIPKFAGPYAFSTTGGAKPVSGFSWAKARLDRLSGVSAWRVHDLRRTVATGLQRLGVRLEVTEAVLGHVSGSRAGIVAVYQHHQYGPEKRAALEAWGREVERIVTGAEAKVVAFAGAGG